MDILQQVFRMRTPRILLHIVPWLVLIQSPGFGTAQGSSVVTVVETRAGWNVSLACPGASDTFVLFLEWGCQECQVPNAADPNAEVKLAEYRAESITEFHYEERIHVWPNNYSISFLPARAHDSGLYICRVNSRTDDPRSTRLIVKDVPDPPGRPLIMTFNSRSVNLSWTPSKNNHHSPITHYIIHIREGEGGHWDVDNGRATTTNDTHFNVDNLAPFTVYSFRVAAVNAMGMSNTSKESYYIVTLREAPIGKPVFTAAHNCSSTSIEISWKPPHMSTIHGEFQGYVINLRPRDEDHISDNDIVTVHIHDPNATSHVIQGLKTYTQYLVSLQVVNPEGLGPAATVAVMTDEGKKKADLYDINNPDWAPTVNMGYKERQSTELQEQRYKRCERKRKSYAAQLSESSTVASGLILSNDDGGASSEIHHCNDPLLETNPSSICQTEITGDLLDGVFKELQELRTENIALKQDMKSTCSRFEPENFQGSDEKVKYFAGLCSILF